MNARLPEPKPIVVRVCHWLNAFAIVVMVASGWRIYNASPIFNFMFPDGLTLGGWLGGAIQWHLAGIWLLVGNGLFYLIYNVAIGRWRAFWPLRPREIVRDTWAALRLQLPHGNLDRYNPLQRLFYVGVMLCIVVAVASGLVVWKPVQFPLLRAVMGGYDNARVVHFFAMSAIVLFTAVHVMMVAVVPRTISGMIGIWRVRRAG